MDSTLKLIMEKGPREGETLEFRSGSVIRIGRVVRGNTLAIKDAGISSKHLLIEFVLEKGQWIISDLDSSNGTILNGTKLSPTAPSDLTDGDTIKLGEITSIKVQIEIDGNTQLRRNPRRRGAKLELVSESSELGLGVNEKQKNNAEVQIESEGKNQLRQNTRWRGAAAKSGKQDEKLEPVSENTELGLGKLELVSESRELGLGGNEEQRSNDAEVAVEKPIRRARGRARKGVSLKEIRESSCEVQNVEEMSNVGAIQPKQGRQVSTRRTRSSKKEESGGFSSIIGDNLKGFSIDVNNLREPERLVPVVDQRTRGGGRRKRNLQDEKLENLGEECGNASAKNSPVKENLRDVQLEKLDEERATVPEKNSPVKKNLGNEQLDYLGEECGEASKKNFPVRENLGDEQLETLGKERAEVSVKNSPVKEKLGDEKLENLGEECGKESEKTSPVKDNSANLPSEAVRVDVLEEKENEGLATTSGVKDGGVDVGEAPNLEKMTLGEWFDYVEVNLPKEIYDATEEMILGMRKKADKFHEFMLQQKNARDKCPMDEMGSSKLYSM